MSRRNPATFAIMPDDLDRMRIDEPRGALDPIHPIAMKLMLQHFDFVLERLVQPPHQVVGTNVLLDPVTAPIKPTLPPTGKIEHGLANGLGRDRPGMHRNPTNPPPLFDNEHRLPKLRRLHRAPAPGRSAANDDEIV